LSSFPLATRHGGLIFCHHVSTAIPNTPQFEIPGSYAAVRCRFPHSPTCGGRPLVG
jgi:hypothetical protein